MSQNQNSGQGGNHGNSKTGSTSASHGTSNRGFASMDEDKQREISKKGGEASHGGGNRSDDSNSGRSSSDSSDRGNNR